MIARVKTFLRRLGPGLITGAADDDPSGIATYSQAGAQFGCGMLWSVLLTTPLMVGIQIVSARMGRGTGHGGAPHYHALGFGLVAVAFQLLVPYQRLAPVLKWLTLSLVSYAFVLFMVDVPWGQVAAETLVPPMSFKRDRKSTRLNSVTFRSRMPSSA